MRNVEWIEVEIEGPNGHEFIRVVAYSAAEATMRIQKLCPQARVIDAKYLAKGKSKITESEQKRMGII